MAEQRGGPVEPGRSEEAGGEVRGAARLDQRIDAGLGRRIGRCAERQSNGSQAQFEQAVAACRLQVILALGRGACDKFDLARIEAKALIDGAGLRLDRAVVRQEDALRAALDDGWRDRRSSDVGKALGREQDRDILLAQDLEPFADPGRE